MKTANLTVVFVAMDDFGERMGRLSYEDQAALAAVFEALTVPVAKKYGGQKIKTVQESQLFTFPSPTSAMKAAAAMQDRAERYSAAVSPSMLVRLRIGAASGEVRVFRHDVYGEPVNLAARVKGLAHLGEVLLTGGVQLSMNRAEVMTQPVGREKFKGVPEPVVLHRLACSKGSVDTYGGAALDVLGLPDLDESDARAMAAGWLAWRMTRVRRSLKNLREWRQGERYSKHPPPREDDSQRALEPRLRFDLASMGEKCRAMVERASLFAGSTLSRGQHSFGRKAAVSASFAFMLVAALVLFFAFGRQEKFQALDDESARALLPSLEERVTQSPEDHAARAALAHALVRTGRRDSAVRHYLRVANADASALGTVHMDDVAALLAIPGEATGDAEAALLRIGRSAVPSLTAVWEDETASRYHRRRVGQVLVGLGQDIDIVPIWIATLDSNHCAARELAARELSRLGDERAIPALRRASNEGCAAGRRASRRAVATLSNE